MLPINRHIVHRVSGKLMTYHNALLGVNLFDFGLSVIFMCYKIQATLAGHCLIILMHFLFLCWCRSCGEIIPSSWISNTR